MKLFDENLAFFSRQNLVSILTEVFYLWRRKPQDVGAPQTCNLKEYDDQKSYLNLNKYCNFVLAALRVNIQKYTNNAVFNVSIKILAFVLDFPEYLSVYQKF